MSTIMDIEPGRYAVFDPHEPLTVIAVKIGPDRRVMFVSYGEPAGYRRPAGWMAALIDAVAADPAAAQTMYGRTTSRCHVCGRALSDPDSQARGIGPDCRARRNQAAP